MSDLWGGGIRRGSQGDGGREGAGGGAVVVSFVTSFLLISSSTRGFSTTLASPLPNSPWQQAEGGRGRQSGRTGEGSGWGHQADSAKLLPSFFVTGRQKRWWEGHCVSPALFL